MQEYPSIRYRLTDGRIEKRLFLDKPPEGWHESPAGLAPMSEPQEAHFAAGLAEKYPGPPKRRGRPKGSKNKPKAVENA